MRLLFKYFLRSAASIALLWHAGTATAGPDRASYAAQCASEMGKIPAFHCLQGELLDIKVNGAIQSQPVQACDNPVQLGLGGDSQCVPFSRLLKIDTGNPNVTTIAICRKYFASKDKNDPRFDDIAMIQHNRNSGRTCFFQSHIAEEPSEGLDGTTVPGPSDPGASKYWLDTFTPDASELSVSGIGCTHCHAADPFIWSPFIAQKANLSTWNANGKYDSNFAGLFGTPTKVFHPDNNLCVSCHRFGRKPGDQANEFSCDALAHRYAGTNFHLSNPGTFSSSFVMPSPLPATVKNPNDWTAAYQSSFDDILSCCGDPDQAKCKSRLANDELRDDGSRFAAIWAQQEGPPYIARHGLTAADYQQEFDKLGNDGFCLVDVSGYEVNGKSRFAAIWEKKSCPAYVARHGLTAQQYQQEFTKLTGQGLRLKLVNGYTLAGEARYAAIWEKSPGPAYVARHGLTAQQYQQEFTKLAQQGFCLSQVSGYAVGNQSHYAAIWEKKSCPAYVARHGLTAQQYQQEFTKLTGEGFRLAMVNGHKINGEPRYAAIWQKIPGPGFVARHGLSSTRYQEDFNKLTAQDKLRLVWVSGY